MSDAAWEKMMEMVGELMVFAGSTLSFHKGVSYFVEEGGRDWREAEYFNGGTAFPYREKR